MFLFVTAFPISLSGQGSVTNSWLTTKTWTLSRPEKVCPPPETAGILTVDSNVYPDPESVINHKAPPELKSCIVIFAPDPLPVLSTNSISWTVWTTFESKGNKFCFSILKSSYTWNSSSPLPTKAPTL